MTVAAGGVALKPPSEKERMSTRRLVDVGMSRHVRIFEN
jgi:hypothetical protein